MELYVVGGNGKIIDDDTKVDTQKTFEKIGSKIIQNRLFQSGTNNPINSVNSIKHDNINIGGIKKYNALYKNNKMKII